MARVDLETEGAGGHDASDEHHESTDKNQEFATTNDYDAITHDNGAFSYSARSDGSDTRANNAIETRGFLLPIEVHERIIGSLDNCTESGTIAACALVCRTWLPFSRFKLYYIIELRRRRQWVAFKNLILHAHSVAIRGYLSMVRQLHIWPYDPFLEFSEFYLRNRGEQIVKNHLWAHLPLLQCAARLKGLTEIDIRCSDLSPSHIIAICSGRHYPSVTTLNLSETTFSSVSQFNEFVAAFPALRHLSLSEITFNFLGAGPPVNKIGHPLRSLNIHDLDNDGILKCFSLNTQLVESLSVLRWSCPRNEDKFWGQLMPAISSPYYTSLKTLVYHTESSGSGGV